MRTRRLEMIIVAAAALLAATGTALAQGPGPGAGRGSGPRAWRGEGERGVERLDLSEEQRAAIREIRAEGGATGRDLRKEMIRLENELRGELLKDEPDAEAAAALVGKIGDLSTKLQLNRLETRLAVRGELTPEQRDKMLLSGGGPGRGERGLVGRGRGGRGPRRGHGRGCGQRDDCPRFDDD